MNNVCPHRLYRHFKGEYFYVICLGSLCSQDDEGGEFVVYQSVDMDSYVYIRPHREWFDDVTKHEDNITGQEQRFELVENVDNMLCSIPTETLYQELKNRCDSPLTILGEEYTSQLYTEDFILAKVLNQQGEEVLTDIYSYPTQEEAVHVQQNESRHKGKSRRMFKRQYIEIGLKS